MDVTTGMSVQSAITPTAGAAGTTDINGSVVDMANFQQVVAVVYMGAITAGAVTSVKWQQGDVVDDADAPTDITDAADLAGTGITIAADDDEEIFTSTLICPSDRYVRIVVDRGTQNAVVASAVYHKFGARTHPTTISVDDSVTFERHVTPAEGTA